MAAQLAAIAPLSPRSDRRAEELEWVRSARPGPPPPLVQELAQHVIISDPLLMQLPGGGG
jgi:hypothetical protein